MVPPPMKRYWAYLRYVLRHKWFVGVAARELGGLGFALFSLRHDLSKLLPSEFVPYSRYFYEPDGRPRQRRDSTGDSAFDWAWLLHQKRNRHHWQWYIVPLDDGGTKALPMPERYRLEMLADWVGAGLAQGYGRNTIGWYAKNRDKMVLHPETRAWVEDMLGYSHVADVVGSARVRWEGPAG